MRPAFFKKDKTWKWDIRLSNAAGAVNGDANPTVTVYKEGVATGESVTVTKPAATTGWYQCSFDPAGEEEHDVYGFSEAVTISGVAQPPFHWHAVVVLAERGTDSAALASGVSLVDNAITTAKIADNAFTAAKFASGAFDAVWTAGTRTLTSFGTLVADIWSSVSRTLTGTVTLATAQPNYAPAKAGDAMTLTTNERTAIANEVEAQIIDDTDSERVLQAIVDKIAAVNPSLDDLTLSAIASAVRTELAVELARINRPLNEVASQLSVDTIDDLLDTEMAATKTAAEAAKLAAESADGKLSNTVLEKINNSAQTGADADTLETLSDQLDAMLVEIEKVPRVGETHRFVRVARDTEEHSADVSIEVVGS